MKKSFSFYTHHLHLDSGEIVPAQVKCIPGEPLEIKMGKYGGSDYVLDESIHIALARADTHVHFRESYLPTREEFENDPYHSKEQSYEDIIQKIEQANRNYDARRGSLAALKGGVWLVGAMGNTPWPPLGEQRWRKTCEVYRKQAKIYTHVWPRIEPGIPPITGQDEKDFGSTFGGVGISSKQRRQMYLERKGQTISYHNDQPKKDISIEEFQKKFRPPNYLLPHLYYDGETVLASQRETIELAKEAELARLHTRHIPTGPGLDMILQERNRTQAIEFLAEVGLDYLYFNRDMLADRETRWFNYRRPSLPSKEDQASLITITRECARKRDPLTFIGSDHAPHPLLAKEFSPVGLPGSPGTRLLEHSHQIHMHLIHHHNFTHADIDWLTAIGPAKYIAKYRGFPYEIGKMETGAMANLVIFDPEVEYKVDETRLKEILHDQEYHTAYRDETLRGKVLFTVVNGMIYDVRDEIKVVNG